jgi:hypothetical protein
MQQRFRSFVSADNLPPQSVSYHDYVVVHLLFEAARDAGFWNMQWSVTEQPPNSDSIGRQWRSVDQPSVETDRHGGMRRAFRAVCISI